MSSKGNVKCWSGGSNEPPDLAIYIYIYVRTKKSYSLGPLRIVGCTIQSWLKTMNLLERETNNKRGAKPKDSNKEENEDVIK